MEFIDVFFNSMQKQTLGEVKTKIHI